MFIDLHSHVLPGIDDGAPSLDISMKMLRRAASTGICAIVATPHVLDNPSPAWEKNLIALYQTVSRAVIDERLDIDLYLGAELFFQFGIESLAERTFGTYRGMGKYCLVETPMSQYPPQFEQTVQELVSEKITPVVAHPERIGPLIGDVKRVTILARAGACIQVSAGSLLGQFGRQVQTFAWELLDQGIVHVLASDAHDVDHRTFNLHTASEAVAERYDDDTAEALTCKNPLRVLLGESVVPVIPGRVGR